jgi:hypothetical protein
MSVRPAVVLTFTVTGKGAFSPSPYYACELCGALFNSATVSPKRNSTVHFVDGVNTGPIDNSSLFLLDELPDGGVVGKWLTEKVGGPEFKPRLGSGPCRSESIDKNAIVPAIIIWCLCLILTLVGTTFKI